MKDFVELSEYPNYYIAHSPARLLRKVNGILHECKQCPNSKQDNYWIVTVKTVTGQSVKRSMHRLLMLTFVPNPDNKAHVNHIDGNKSNNSLSNLEWATPKENAQHAIATGLKSTDVLNKEVHQYNLDGTYIASYASGPLAEKATGIPKQNISKCVCNKRIHAGYKRWTSKYTSNLSPIKHSYIKSYTLDGITYKTIRLMAEAYNIAYPEKATLSRFPKKLRNQIIKNYYK